MSGPVLLDISRLISRAARPTPSGIDRIELAYAEHLLVRIPGRIGFVAMNDAGEIAPIGAGVARQLVTTLARQWRTPDAQGKAARRAGWWARLSALAPARQHRSAGRAIYIHVSHQNLHHPERFARLKAKTGAAFLFLVHDLIPIEFPEYARPGQAERHRRRIDTICTLADGIIANSAATASAIAPFLSRAGRSIPVIVAHPGAEFPETHTTPHTTTQTTPQTTPQPATPPYFVCIGTIEPRKNHLLLLQLWRRLAEHSTAPPKLHLVGQRGWENEMVVDMLERCAALDGLVVEHRGLPDHALRPLLAGACALLNPSFAEGYGMPVAEALAQRVSVLCSDLPVFREVGGDVPEFLDPLDGPAWLRAITDYAQPASPRRMAQLVRMPSWHAPGWPQHIDAVMDLVAQVGG